MSREHLKAPDLSAQQQANELIRLIRKLRWMGMEEEVESAGAELAQRDAVACSTCPVAMLVRFKAAQVARAFGRQHDSAILPTFAWESWLASAMR